MPIQKHTAAQALTKTLVAFWMTSIISAICAGLIAMVSKVLAPLFATLNP